MPTPAAAPTLRPADPGDLSGVTRLVQAHDLATVGEIDWSETDQRDEWRGVDLAADTRVCDVHGGEVGDAIVGYARATGEPSDLHGEVVVDPALPTGAAAATDRALLDWVLARARERAGAEGGRITVVEAAHDEPALARLAERGFMRTRTYHRMGMRLAMRPEPVPAPGVRIRPHVFGTDDDRAMHAVIEEAFADHHGVTRRSYEDFADRYFRDPDLVGGAPWLLAETVSAPPQAGSPRVVGGLMGLDDIEDRGWIRNVGVLPGHRRRGVAVALLSAALVAFWDLGKRRVGLGVDAQNAYRATAVYEKVGMEVERSYAFLTLELSPGPHRPEPPPPHGDRPRA